jgi:predicted transcriptional regulator
MPEKILFDSEEIRRDRVQVLHDILTVSVKPERATRLLRHANVRYGLFREYVDILCNSGLLEKKNMGERNRKPCTYYQITKMGDEWCKMIKSVYNDLEKDKG